MFKLVNKLVGFKTKDLYLAELGVYNSVYVGGIGLNATYKINCFSYKPPKYILCRKIFQDSYFDVFTKSEYEKYDDSYHDNGEVLVKKISPIVSNKG